MTAGAFGQFIASPTDLVKVQMQMEGKRVLIEGRQPRYRVLNSNFTLAFLRSERPGKNNFLSSFHASAHLKFDMRAQ